MESCEKMKDFRELEFAVFCIDKKWETAISL